MTPLVNITIGGETHQLPSGLNKASALLPLARLVGSEQLLLERTNDLDIPVSPPDGIILRGGEKFVIGKGGLPDNPCLRHPPHIHFNGVPVPPEKLFPHAKATAAELKTLDPDAKSSDKVFADIPDLADEFIPDDLRMILQKHDRYQVTPCGNVGFSPVIDAHLNKVKAQFPDAHIEQAGNQMYLVVPGYKLPAGWSASEVTVMCQVPNGFPLAQMDMFWVSPKICLSNGAEPNCGNHHETHLGQQWQRFSWHYAANGWKPNQSDLLSHLQFCRSRLQDLT